MAIEGTGAVPARELGQGWKVSPSIDIPARGSATLAEIQGPGAIQHIWLTIHPDKWRRFVIRIFWDGEEHPSVEVPLGDFFCNGWGVRCNIASLPVAVLAVMEAQAFVQPDINELFELGLSFLPKESVVARL